VDDHIYPPNSTFVRWQDNLQLHYTYSGSTEIKVDNQTWTQHTGEISLLLPGHQECFRYSKDSPTHHGFCTAAGAVLSSEQTGLYEALPRTVKTSPRIRMLTDLAKVLHEEKTGAARNLYNRIAEMIFAEFFYTVGLPSSKDSALPVAIHRALDFMETHCAESFTLDQLAQFCFVSQVHLIRLFKQHLNITPVRYLWRLRLRHAAEKLIGTEMNVSEVAFQCGFISSDHFSRLFKQNYILSPRSYRAAKRLKQNGS